MKCARCNSTTLVQITLQVGGRDLTMRSCSTCDVRSWATEGEGLDLARVLDLATARR